MFLLNLNKFDEFLRVFFFKIRWWFLFLLRYFWCFNFFKSLVIVICVVLIVVVIFWWVKWIFNWVLLGICWLNFCFNNNNNWCRWFFICCCFAIVNKVCVCWKSFFNWGNNFWVSFGEVFILSIVWYIK